MLRKQLSNLSDAVGERRSSLGASDRPGASLSPTVGRRSNSSSGQLDQAKLNASPADFTSTLTPEEALAELKERCAASISVNPSRFDDMYLLRFLRWRKFNVDVVAQLFDTHVKWYIENNIGSLIADIESNKKFDFIREYYPLAIYERVSKEGFPIMYDRTGKTDLRGLFSRYTLDEILLFHTYGLEKRFQKLLELSTKHGKRVDQAVVIVDMTGLGWRNIYPPAISMLQGMVNTLRFHYPEMVRSIFIINNPAVFDILWKGVKPFMPSGLLLKVEICGTSDYKQRLLNVIDSASLPVEWGGSCEVPILKGGLVGDHQEDQYNRTLTVSSTHEVVVDVTIPDSCIAYEFSTAAHDIGFGILFGAQREVVQATTRYDCSTQSVQGRFRAIKAGKYVLLFDNSFSMLRSKVLTFQIDLQTPSEALSTE